MSQNAAPSLSPASNGPFAQDQYGASPVKNLADTANPSASRRWFCNLLWRAFPATSEHDLAHKAAPALGVSPRQVRNWLREEHDASLRYVTAVLAIAGAEIIFGKIEGGR